MRGLALFLAIRLMRGPALKRLLDVFHMRGGRGADLLFALSYSTQESVHELFLLEWAMRLIDWLSVLTLAVGFSQMLGIPASYALGGMSLVMMVGLLRLISGMQRHQMRLIEELSSFVFRYEMALLGGRNQYLAIREATKTLSLLEAREDVDGYMEELDKLFLASKWMVIKKVIILLERGKHFTGESLSMDFAQVSSELFERFRRAKRIEQEKRENLILLPMSANMLIMIMYVVTPFLSEFIWRA